MNLSYLPDKLSSAQRMELQSAIEKAILRLGPDYDDAHDILDALMVALKRRYNSAQLWDCEHYATYFGQALERIPLLAEPEIDVMDAYRASLDD